MSFDHAMNCTAFIRPEVSVEEVQTALRPLFDLFGYSDTLVNQEQDLDKDHMIDFNQETRVLELYTNGNVSTGSYDNLSELAVNLSTLVSEPGKITLWNHDTADLDNARSEFFFGPSKEEIRKYEFNEHLTAAASNLLQYIGESGVEELKALALNAFQTNDTAQTELRGDADINSLGDEREYVVGVVRSSSSKIREITVRATSETKAKSAALDIAGDFTYSESEADYQVETVRQGDKQCTPA